MSSDLTKKAVEMLLKGATLVSEPCPYCKGVRVIKDGHALCVNCGKEPDFNESEPGVETLTHGKKEKTSSTLNVLEQKLRNLTNELNQEKDHKKQQQILKSINSLVDLIDKVKNQE